MGPLAPRTPKGQLLTQWGPSRKWAHWAQASEPWVEERRSGSMVFQDQFHTSQQELAQPFRILHSQTLALSGLPVPLYGLEIWPYHSLDPPVLPHPLSLRDPGAATVPSHCTWQCPPRVGIPGGRKSIQLHGQTHEAPCSGGPGVKGGGSLPRPDLYALIPQPQGLLPNSHQSIYRKLSKGFQVPPEQLHPSGPSPNPFLTLPPHCTHSESCSGSHRHLLGCSFGKTGTDWGLGPSIPQRSTVGHTLCLLPLERKGWVRRSLRSPNKPFPELLLVTASSLMSPSPWLCPPSLLPLAGQSSPYTLLLPDSTAPSVGPFPHRSLCGADYA